MFDFLMKQKQNRDNEHPPSFRSDKRNDALFLECLPNRFGLRWQCSNVPTLLLHSKVAVLIISVSGHLRPNCSRRWFELSSKISVFRFDTFKTGNWHTHKCSWTTTEKLKIFHQSIGLYERTISWRLGNSPKMKSNFSSQTLTSIWNRTTRIDMFTPRSIHHVWEKMINCKIRCAKFFFSLGPTKRRGRSF